MNHYCKRHLNANRFSRMTLRGSELLALVALAAACSGNSDLGGKSDANAGTGSNSGGSAAVQTGTTHSNTGGATAVASNAKGGANDTATGSMPPTTTANGGSGSTGLCTIQECFRNVRCVTSCGGPVVQDGCCACPIGSFDSLQCSTNSGGAAAAGGSSSTGGVLTTTGGNLGKGGGSPAVGGASTSRGGATASAGSDVKGGAASRGGTSSTSVDCNAMVCFRAINCVATCGGPILQSGCCPCPTGTFDSYTCNAAGGAAGAAGSTPAAGTNSLGGATSSGGSSSIAECQLASDCHIVGDCCGCHSLPLNQGSDCALECLSSPGTCGGFDPQPTAECRAGRCVLNRTCDDSRAMCLLATPACDAGQLPSLTMEGTCWDGNCIDIAECSSVRSCSQCKDAGMLCVYDWGKVGVAHCVKVAATCASAKLCSCFGDLCGDVSACGELADGTGISCGSG